MSDLTDRQIDAHQTRMRSAFPDVFADLDREAAEVEASLADGECDKCSHPIGYWRERGRVLCDACELDADKPAPLALKLEDAA